MIMKYVHYGNEKFDKSKFKEVKNQMGSPKPSGGFWASPHNSKFGWKEWSKDKNINANTDVSFLFTLKSDARVLTIDNVNQLTELPKSDCGLLISISGWTFLDYEKLAESYDAIEVWISKDGRLYEELYTWDCDSILIINPDIMQLE